MSLKPADIFAAVVPAGAAISLADLNHLVAIGGALLGSAYLIWKWRREALRKTQPPFHRD